MKVRMKRNIYVTMASLLMYSMYKTQETRLLFL